MIEKTITTKLYNGIEITDFEQDGRPEGSGSDVVLVANGEGDFDVVEREDMGTYIDWLMENNDWNAIDLLRFGGGTVVNLYVDFLRYGILTDEPESGLIRELGEGQIYNTITDAEELEELTYNVKIDVDYDA